MTKWSCNSFTNQKFLAFAEIFFLKKLSIKSQHRVLDFSCNYKVLETRFNSVLM
jgi:hypothetical protein